MDIAKAKGECRKMKEIGDVQVLETTKPKP
jgi:hypothetical protein